ncbi:MAG: helix-turn-helix transcriptional regulator [Lachnospiraceae bacterium]|nr:helix-turn-helix transcriptional regulator [Lachnospiraceae bacterium]
MTNEILLRQKIDASGLKMRFIAEKIGISYQALLNKIRNKTEFTAQEILRFSELLHLTIDEKEAIFFCMNVDDMSTATA